jgi:hypothetical protein
MLYGLAAALDGRHRATGWWLDTSPAFQPLAFLAVRIALAFLKKRPWLAAIVPMIAIPLAFLVVPLATWCPWPRGAPGQRADGHRQPAYPQKVYRDSGYISPTWNPDPVVAAGDVCPSDLIQLVGPYSRAGSMVTVANPHRPDNSYLERTPGLVTDPRPQATALDEQVSVVCQVATRSELGVLF